MADQVIRRVTTRSEAELRSLLKQFFGSLGTATGARYGNARANIKKYRDHIFQTEAAAPPVPTAFNGEIPKADRYQWGGITRQHSLGRARFVASHGLVRIVTPTTHAGDLEIGERAEFQCNIGLVEVERNGLYSIQGALFDGQDLLMYGINHWRKKHLPAIPLYEYRDSLPEDNELDDEPTRERNRRERERFEAYDGKEGRYRETTKSRMDRHHRNKARHGWPWVYEVIDPATYAEEEDPAAPGGIKMAMRVKQVATLDYQRDLEAQDQHYLEINKKGEVVSISPERPSELESESGDQEGYGKLLAIAEIWTPPMHGKPGEWYELVSGNSQAWQLVRSDYHPHTRVPFAKAPGRITLAARPEEKYQPIMVDMYRMKATYDRDVQLLKILAEEVAFPNVVQEVELNAPGTLDETGVDTEIGTMPALRKTLPPGHHIVELKRDIGPAWVRIVADQREEMEKVLPSVGMAPIGGSSEPAMHLRLIQAQEIIGINAAAYHQANAIATMYNDIIHVNSLPASVPVYGPAAGGFGEAICVTRVVEEAVGGQKRKRQEVVTMEPDEWVGLQAEYDIDPLLEQERLTKQQVGLELREKGAIDDLQLYEMYMGFPNAVAQAKRLSVQAAANTVVKGVIEQEIAAAYGKKFVVSADGTAIGMGGRSLSPAEALALKGITLPATPAPLVPGPNGQQMPGQMNPLVDTTSAPAGAIQMPPLAG